MKARLLFLCFLGKAVSLTCYQCPKVISDLDWLRREMSKIIIYFLFQSYSNLNLILILSYSNLIPILFWSGKSGELNLQRWWRPDRMVQKWRMVPKVLEQPKWWVTHDETDFSFSFHRAKSLISVSSYVLLEQPKWWVTDDGTDSSFSFIEPRV